MKILRHALVITPSVFSEHLGECLESVHNQTHRLVDHLIVNDGQPGADDWTKIAIKTYGPTMMNLPWNVGKDGGDWYGHRVYAAMSKLIPQKYDYVFLLDEDNFFEAEHVESCIDAIETNEKLGFVHSLRRIVDKEGIFLLNDDCESLGKFPIMGMIGNHLIDTSSYCFRRDFFRMHGHHWDYGWGGDRYFLSKVVNIVPWEGTGEYTLNYRLDGNEGSVTKEFFLEGNKRTDANRPWSKQ